MDHLSQRAFARFKQRWLSADNCETFRLAFWLIVLTEFPGKNPLAPSPEEAVQRFREAAFKSTFAAVSNGVELPGGTMVREDALEHYYPVMLSEAVVEALPVVFDNSDEALRDAGFAVRVHQRLHHLLTSLHVASTTVQSLRSELFENAGPPPSPSGSDRRGMSLLEA